MDLDTVKASRLGVDGTLAELLDNAGDLLDGQRARRGMGLESTLGERIAVKAHGAWCHRQAAIGLEVMMADPTDMPELQHPRFPTPHPRAEYGRGD